MARPSAAGGRFISNSSQSALGWPAGRPPSLCLRHGRGKAEWRAIRTAQLSLEAADRHWIPVHRSWRLNERHYGALQGKDKAQTLAEFGEEQFMLWRRSYDTPPPPLEDGTEFSQSDDPRYATIPPELRTGEVSATASGRP